MEYIDVLNENGVKTGEILSRDEVHKKGLWHRAAIVIMVNDKNEILMQQRSNTKEKFPGLWDLSVAAHVISGEDPIQTLVRELNEEIGVLINKRIEVKDLRFISSFKNIHSYEDKNLGHIDEKAFYEFFVLYKNFDISMISLNDGEVQDIKWLNYFEILKLRDENKLHPRCEWITEIQKFLNV